MMCVYLLLIRISIHALREEGDCQSHLSHIPL